MTAAFSEVKGGVGSYTLKNGDRRWRVVYWRDGKAQSKAGFITKGEAIAWRDKARTEIREDTFTDPSRGRRKPFGEFAAEWVNSATLRPSTRVVYRQLLAGPLDHWTDRRLAQITPAEVRVWLEDLRTRKARTTTGTLAPSTVAKAYRLLKRVLNVAVSEGYIARNPCQEKVTEEDPDLNVPTKADVLRIGDAIEPRYRALVFVAGFGGLRWGEAVALRRKHVDLTAGVVHIREQLVEMPDGRLHLSPLLKSKAGRRDVYLPAQVVEALTVHLARWAEPGPDGLLFPAVRPVGGRAADRDRQRYLRRSNFRRRVWLPALKQAGLSRVRFHDLRHAAATLLAQHGATSAEVMQQIGHSTPRAALRYQHAEDDRMRLLASRMSATLTDALAPTADNVVPLRRS